MKRLALAAVLAFAVCACRKAGDPPPAAAPAEPETFKVTTQKVQAFIQATGTVQADLDGSAKVLTPLAGAVEAIRVKVGDKVGPGDVLIELRSPEMAETYSNYLAAVAQRGQAERTYNLNRRLLDVGAITKNDLLLSEAAYRQVKAQAEGLKQKLDIYGATVKGEAHDRVVLTAPISGTVVDIPAHVGDRFDTAAALLTIADPAKIVVVANLYDTDAPKLHAGMKVIFNTDIFPRQTFTGVVSYLSDVEDPDLKTVKAYIKIDPPTNLLKQNMFIKLKVLAGQETIAVLPKTALIYKDGRFYVNRKSEGKFELVEVMPLRETSDRMMGVRGLDEGDEVAGSAIELEKP